MPNLRDYIQSVLRCEITVPVAQLVGCRLVSAEGGQAEWELEAGPQHRNPMGTLHGGVLCDIADAAMGMALASLLGEGETFTTLELKINFLKPVWSGHLRARGPVGERLKQNRPSGGAQP